MYCTNRVNKIKVVFWFLVFPKPGHINKRIFCYITNDDKSVFTLAGKLFDEVAVLYRGSNMTTQSLKRVEEKR